MNKTKIILTFLISLIIFYVLFSLLYVRTQGLGGVKLQHDPDQITQKAVIFAKEMNLNTANSNIKIQVAADAELVSFMHHRFGVEEGNYYIRDSVPGFFWDVKWHPKGVSDIHIGKRTEEENRAKDYLGKLVLNFDPKGYLVKFTNIIEDSAALPKISREEARQLAQNFITKYSGIASPQIIDTAFQKDLKRTYTLSYGAKSSGSYEMNVDRKIERPNRTDHEFAWTSETGIKGLKKTISIAIAGNTVSSYSFDYEVEPGYAAGTNSEILNMITKIIIYVIIFILLAVIAYRRIRAYEIGFRMAFIMGIIVAVTAGLDIYMDINQEFSWEILIPLVLGPLFLGAGIVLVWAPGETITREVWKEKFISIDLATKGYVLHSRVGSAILRGLSYGLIISSAALVLLYVFQKAFGMGALMEDNDNLQHFNSAYPGFGVIITNLYGAIFLAGIYFIFIVSGLKRRFQSLPLLIAVCALLFGLGTAGDIEPFIMSVIVEAIIGAAFIYLFIKTDVLLSIAALATYFIASTGYVMFTAGNSAYIHAGVFITVCFFFTAGVAILSLYTKDKITEYGAITPAFEKHITERQRLQRELEIARDVQMSFLPKKNPSFPGLEVASRCIPVLEVGGDYYDFVNINHNKSGIIIGDVSGKGTQAAFYMTLTKGFLKAVSRLSESPSVVLSQMNELFYENVERGTFISMIYGVFDNEKKVFKLSRAGHNPVILKNSPDKIEMLNPTGLALGLEKGIIFGRTIKEMEITYSPGDIFIFYTDGFTEAMNKQKEEYGEERLAALIENSSNMTAEEILQHIIKDVKSFIGTAKQHDDMTMVVVKVIT